MKTTLPSAWVTSGRPQGSVPRGFKTATVLVLLCLGVEVSYWWAAGNPVPPPPPATRSVVVSRPPATRYFRTRQWLADARTLAAVVRYLCEAEPLPRTNHIAVTGTAVKTYS